MYREDGEQESLASTETDWFAEELRYFIDCAAHGRRPDFCPPEESAIAVKLARLMVESRSKNGERIACRL